MKIVTAGENSVIVYFANSASAEISAQIQHTCKHLPQLLGTALIDLTPSYASLLVIYDPLAIDQLGLRAAIQATAAIDRTRDAAAEQLWTLPCYYSVESGPDLVALAERAKLTIEQVIDCHQQQEYRVYAIGFAPGFAYLGDVDPRIATPRLATPRSKVPKGSVAIADQQTAVYPTESPGGWNLIGLCPTTLFDPNATPPMAIRVGDRIQFQAISREEFLALGGAL